MALRGLHLNLGSGWRKPPPARPHEESIFSNLRKWYVHPRGLRISLPQAALSHDYRIEPFDFRGLVLFNNPPRVAPRESCFRRIAVTHRLQCDTM